MNQVKCVLCLCLGSGTVKLAHLARWFGVTLSPYKRAALILDTTRVTPLRDNKTTTTHEPAGPAHLYTSIKLVMLILHSWELERWRPSSLEHPINKHPVFSEASEIEFPRAGAIFSRGEYFEVPPGDEAGVSHADVHRALRGVPADGHRPFLHQILEFSALKPGYSRPRHPAYHRHLQRYWWRFGGVC